jgi:hypothetical protein
MDWTVNSLAAADHKCSCQLTLWLAGCIGLFHKALNKDARIDFPLSSVLKNQNVKIMCLGIVVIEANIHRATHLATEDAYNQQG